MKKLLDGVLIDLSGDELLEAQQRLGEAASMEALSRSLAVRHERDMKLETEVDPIAGNALRWAALSAEQQQAWADYRQALLDIPQQSGFPHNVVWPTKPEV